MKDCVGTAIKRALSRIKVEILGYICWAIGIVLMLVHLDLRAYLFSVGIAAFGVGTGFVGLGVARKSDKRMAAMANLEFREKMAMIQQYIMDMSESGTDEWNKAYADRIFYDLKGAKQLEEWVKDPEIRKTLNDGIQTLIDKVLAGQKHEHLIKRLQQAKEDC
jgi:hypothetical protein